MLKLSSILLDLSIYLSIIYLSTYLSTYLLSIIYHVGTNLYIQNQCVCVCVCVITVQGSKSTLQAELDIWQMSNIWEK